MLFFLSCTISFLSNEGIYPCLFSFYRVFSMDLFYHIVTIYSIFKPMPITSAKIDFEHKKRRLKPPLNRNTTGEGALLHML